MSDMSNKCPKCGKPMCPYHHYYIYESKVIEVCKECMNKQKQHRMFIKVQGKTRVVD